MAKNKITSRADRAGDEPLTPSEALEILGEEFTLIERVPGRCGGQPTIKDTRFRVEDVLYAVANYVDFAAIVKQWGGGYTPESWKEAVLYAANYLGETVPLDRGP